MRLNVNLDKYSWQIPSHVGLPSNLPFQQLMTALPFIEWPALQVTFALSRELIEPVGETVPFGISGSSHGDSEYEKI